jgi:osmotically-inducible protein OsmY
MVAALFSGTALNKRIETSVAESYVFNKYLQNDSVKIDVLDSGEVVLQGTVSGLLEKQLAEEAVNATPGVKRVINKIEITGAKPEEFSDMWIRSRVESMLMLHKGVNVAATNITINDGFITISGSASSMTEKNLTTEYALDVEGVKGVNNLMSVPANYVYQADTVIENVDDASIAALVKTSFLLHKSTVNLQIKVEVYNGVVVLSGNVNRDAEKERLTALASDIRGVRQVNNEVVVDAKSSEKY